MSKIPHKIPNHLDLEITEIVLKLRYNNTASCTYIIYAGMTNNDKMLFHHV